MELTTCYAILKISLHLLTNASLSCKKQKCAKTICGSKEGFIYTTREHTHF